MQDMTRLRSESFQWVIQEGVRSQQMRWPLGQTSKISFWPRRSDVPPTLNYFCPYSQYNLKIGNCKHFLFTFRLPMQ